jgi:hypothetical protein
VIRKYPDPAKSIAILQDYDQELSVKDRAKAAADLLTMQGELEQMEARLINPTPGALPLAPVKAGKAFEGLTLGLVSMQSDIPRKAADTLSLKQAQLEEAQRLLLPIALSTTTPSEKDELWWKHVNAIRDFLRGLLAQSSEDPSFEESSR